jgi:hypothetical protein
LFLASIVLDHSSKFSSNWYIFLAESFIDIAKFLIFSEAKKSALLESSFDRPLKPDKGALRSWAIIEKNLSLFEFNFLSACSEFSNFF